MKRVELAERAENWKTCSSGRYPILCDRSLLSEAQITQVEKAEKVAKKSNSKHSAIRPSRSRGYSGACDSGHWIQEVTSDGSIVTLEDGSIWKVSHIDTIDSMLWLPVDNITACDDKLINIDQSEAVDAEKLN